MLKRMDCHGLSKRGKFRDRNDDQFLIADLNKSMRVHATSLDFDDQTRLFSGSQGKLLLVADGDRRCTAAVDNILSYVLNEMHWISALDSGLSDKLVRDLKSSLLPALGEDASDIAATLAYLCWPRMFIVHAGNTCCYLHRGGRMRRLTAGIDADQGERSPDAAHIELQLDDSLLLCSDGLTEFAAEDRIAAALGTAATAESTCERLIGLVEETEASDNVTVVVAKFLDHSTQLQSAEAEGSVPQQADEQGANDLEERHASPVAEGETGDEFRFE